MKDFKRYEDNLKADRKPSGISNGEWKRLRAAWHNRQLDNPVKKVRSKSSKAAKAVIAGVLGAFSNKGLML